MGGVTLGLRKTQPWATASSGAGPSYGNPRPTKTLDCWGEGRSEAGKSEGEGGRWWGGVRGREGEGRW